MSTYRADDTSPVVARSVAYAKSVMLGGVVRESKSKPILVCCSWCIRSDGLVIDAPHHLISHSICERHERELLEGIET